MNRLVVVVLVFLFPVSLFTQHAEIIHMEELDSLLNQKEDKLYVINFWATWCRPCVAELPYFEKAQQTFDANEVEIVLISLNFSEEFDTKLTAFIESRSIKSQVYLLDEIKYNDWIDKVDVNWGGAIPATLFYNPFRGTRLFSERQFEQEELITLIDILKEK